jgi:hypothetical protein
MDSYRDFKSITDKYYTDWIMPDFAVFEVLLNKYGVRLRNKDGDAKYATFSVPISKQDALVLGIRYTKIDGSWTEDLFLFELGKPIVAGYKGRLEKIIPEYKGTHKASP